MSIYLGSLNSKPNVGKTKLIEKTFFCGISIEPYLGSFPSCYIHLSGSDGAQESLDPAAAASLAVEPSWEEMPAAASLAVEQASGEMPAAAAASLAVEQASVEMPAAASLAVEQASSEMPAAAASLAVDSPSLEMPATATAADSAAAADKRESASEEIVYYYGFDHELKMAWRMDAGGSEKDMEFTDDLFIGTAQADH